MSRQMVRSNIYFDGRLVGESISITSVQGEPQFGYCWAVGCPWLATEETMVGCHFCQDHFLMFYSNETFAIDENREWVRAS